MIANNPYNNTIIKNIAGRLPENSRDSFVDTQSPKRQQKRLRLDAQEQPSIGVTLNHLTSSLVKVAKRLFES